MLAAAIFILIVGLSPAAGLLNLLFLPLTVSIALWLYFRRPLAYLQFVFWLWMLTPLIRRLADFHSSYHSVSIIMVAPLAATLVSILSVVRVKRTVEGGFILPYVIVGIVIFYGFVLGAASAGLVAATFGFLNWIVGPIFALHILFAPQSARSKSDAIFRTFTTSLLIIGGYGVYQFWYLPPWDEYWMRMSELTSIGYPAPQMVRVFSTMNSPAPLALFLETGLLISLVMSRPFQKLWLLPGLVGFVLTLARSAWGGFMLGLLVLIWSADVKRKMWYLGGIGFLALAVVPLAVGGGLGDLVSRRTSGLSDLSQDESLTARINLYDSFSGSGISSIVGTGLGTTGLVGARLGAVNQESAASVIDSGILETFSIFGVISALLFVALSALTFFAWRSSTLDPRAGVAFAVAVAAIGQMPLANVLLGAGAMCVYPFIALSTLFEIERSGQRTPSGVGPVHRRVRSASATSVARMGAAS